MRPVAPEGKGTAKPRAASLANKVLRWYARNGRGLPWRGTRDPYRVMVSEFMLQQTRVETVIPYYERFLIKFPSIQILARSPLEEVLKAWENLGYYVRARNLHATAMEIVTRHQGEIPPNRANLIALPGIGPYTADAILSLAFGQAQPAVDGNIRRLITRVNALRGSRPPSRNQGRIADMVTQLLAHGSPPRLLQGLMDLGATVCRPRKPSCTSCPLRSECLAFRKGIERDLPGIVSRRGLPCREMVAAVIHDRRNRLLIVQRPLGGLLGGMWRLPGGEKGPGEASDEALRRTVKGDVGLSVRVLNRSPLLQVKHAFTHFRMTLEAFHCSWEKEGPGAINVARWRWATIEDLDALPFPKADRAVLKGLRRAP